MSQGLVPVPEAGERDSSESVVGKPFVRISGECGVSFDKMIIDLEQKLQLFI